MLTFDHLPPAAWIWADADHAAEGQLALFRLTFSATDSASWTGFADTFYTLYCNGAVVGVGPATGIYMQPRLTTWDLTPYLRDGDNVLALEVWFDGRGSAISDADPWRAGVLGWLTTPTDVIPTGPAWRAREAGLFTLARPEARSFGAKRIVIADLRALPDDWTTPEYADGDWPNATVIAPHPDPARPTLRLSMLPLLTQTMRRPAGIIDAGIVREGTPVAAAEDVARRMWAQTQQSALRCVSIMTVLSADEREGTAYGLPEAARMAALGWPDQSAGFQGPLTLPAVDGEWYLSFDLGLQTSGNLWLEVESAQPLTIDVGYADHLHLGRVHPGLQGHAYAERLLLAPGRRTVHLPHDRGFRYLQCTFSAPALLHDLWVAEHVYPHDVVTRFHCSDATLNAIWEMACATLHQCSVTSHFDNARRERQGWGGPDLYAQTHGFFHAFGDLRLTRKMLEDFLDFFDAHGFIPNWAPAIAPAVQWISAHDLWFPIAAWDYLRYADDRELAPRLLAASEAVLAYYGQHTADDLLARAHDGACRWAGWNMNAAQQCSTWENLLAVVAWRSIGGLRDYLAQPGAAEAVAAAEGLCEAINARLWHPQHQALAQGTRDDGTLLDFCGQVDNAFALLHDILPAERRTAAYRFCAGPSGTWPTSRSDWQGAGQGERVRYDPRKPVVAGTPFDSSLCAQAIARFASPAEAVQYLRYNFGAMLDEGEGTLWEMWPVHQREDIAATCFSQGYGSHITATLIGSLLGLTFLAPGGRVLRWRPADNGVAWLEGRVETRYGPVFVRRDTAGLHYQIPDGVTLHIERETGAEEIAGPAEA